MCTWNMQDPEPQDQYSLLPLRKSNSTKWRLFSSPISNEVDGLEFIKCDHELWKNQDNDNNSERCHASIHGNFP